MSEKFEKEVMAIITETVHCCFDNVSDVDGLEKIFVFLWNEGDDAYVEYDYKIDGKIVERQHVSEYADEMQESTIDELKIALIKLQELHFENQVDLPSAYKILYDHESGQLDVDFEYESLEPDGKWSGEFYLEWVNSEVSK